MSLRVHLDADLCNGYGNCVMAAPGVFDLDQETNIAHVRPGRIADSDLAAAQEAEADCPARAIRLTSE
jgi:ferredoxin